MLEYGIDIGSVSLKVAEFCQNQLTRTQYIKHHGSPFDLLLKILKEIGKIDRLAVTGNFPKALCEMLGAIRINEVEASVNGVMHYCPEAKSIIEIGGEDSKLILIDHGLKDFSSNTMCAAGAGMFLDQQARRLCFEVEDLGHIALQSRNPARIAGRCSVFAKSDMIHLQQIGTPPEDLIAGLCLALARTFKSVIARGKKLEYPVAFIGGVAGNSGVVKAFQTVLGIRPEDLIIPDNHNTISAIGAVLQTVNLHDTRQYRGVEELEKWLDQPKTLTRLPPLNGRKKWSPVISARPPQTKISGYLGIDIGSISTNLVLLDLNGQILARQYLWTKGRPIEVVLNGLRELGREMTDKVEVIGVGTTGSGRYLIGEFVGADVIKNEISAQARAAIDIDPEVDTIFEIGGQDSKFISIDNKTIVDFEMNKVCAAGTGSFLEEQAQALGVRLEEFGDLALDAPSPINLGERCTVFIGSEVIHHQGDSEERENLLAGLGYSIVFNYLNRVVGSKRIGERIFFQGGVAANKAVVSAFEEVLKKQVIVPPNYDVTGAIGIALLARDAGINRTNFRGFDLIKKAYKSSSFLCHHCSNECEVNRISVAGEKPIFYGGRCERYEKKENKAGIHLPDLFALRNRIFFTTEKADGIEIGIPRSLIFYELFPFFYKFLVNLGFIPVLSDETNRMIVEQGTEVSSADTCFPVKVAYGHIKSLIDRGIRQFFVPSVITMPPNNPDFSRSFVCPYVQTIPYLIRAAFGDNIKVLAPYLYFDRGKEGFYNSLIEFGKEMDRTEQEIRKAIAAGNQYQAEVQEKLRVTGQQALKELKNLAFVVCSRPYNGYDLGLNLDLPKKIRDLGVLPVPIDLLTLDYNVLKEDFSNMYWHYGQKILAAAETISKDERLFPVYLSNFSCGPDSFLTRYFKEKLGEKPSLLIEIDEHSGDAGFITRLEAFCDSIKGARKHSNPRKIKARSEVKSGRTIYIPDMCDQAQVLASAMLYTGINARILPSPDETSVLIGRQFTNGRECLPAIITAGDMIKKIQSRDFNPEKSAFFMAQGSGPCRFGQYYKLHRIILDNLGLNEIPIYAPNQGPSLFDDLIGPMGLKFLFLAWDGICAVDALETKVRKIRPYETTKGNADKIYRNSLETIYRKIEQGKSIIPMLRQAAEKLKAIELEYKTIPRIGIVGEIYVRSQKFSNNFLIKKLEELGCEVAMPSIGEWFFYTNFTRMKNCRWFGQYRRVVFTKIFNRYMEWRQHQIYKIVGLEKEPEIIGLLNQADPYLHSSFEGEAVLSIGKTLECIKESYSGVINVMPFTCMPGNIVSSIYKRIKDQHKDFPLFVLSVDGVDHAVDSMRLETFVNQARSVHFEA